MKFHNADPNITSILTPWPLVYELLGNNRRYWKGKLTDIHRTGHSVHLVFKVLLWWAVTQYLYILCPVRKPYLHSSSSVSLLPNFPILFLLNPWPSSQIISSSLWIDVESFVWPFVILGKMDNYMICSKSSPQKEFPFTMSQSGVAVLHLSTFRWFPHIMKNYL